jgi:parvulin-like peptidyl-prolyl isomerase
MADDPHPPAETAGATGPSGAPEPASQRRALWLLAVGAGVGLAAAAIGLMRGPEGAGGLPSHAVASVNGEILRVEEYERAVAALASDRREPIGAEEKRHVLDRLLDEELLVQRGLELGLARHDRRVRGDIVSAVIQAVLQQAEETGASDADVREFYEENRDYFTRGGRVFVQQILVRGPPQRDGKESLRRAEEAAARLRAGEPIDSVQERLGDPQVAPLPADYLPAAKLREYLGPTATREALRLAPGQVSDPVRSASGHHVLQLVDREEARVPPLAEIESEVRAELRRRAGDLALRDYLDELRDRADVRVADRLP